MSPSFIPICGDSKAVDMVINMEIRFYKTSDEYGCFSIFYYSPFQIDGRIWKTSEHYFQAQKYAWNSTLFEQIWKIESPMQAAILGRSRDIPIRQDWEEVKLSVMRKCVYAKFSQSEELRTVMLSTGSATLIEATTTDLFWGCGHNNCGQNMLGIILMEIRDKLRIQSENTDC